MNDDATALTGTAVTEVADLAQRASTLQIHTSDNVEFSDRPLHRIDADPRLPVAREFYTLDGLIGFVKQEPLTKKALLHVVSPVRVDLISRLYGADDHLRAVYGAATCKSAGMHGFSFNGPVPLETLSIALLTCFEAGRGQIDDLRKFCASVKSSNELGVADDGVSQTVAAKSGISAVLTTAVTNPWALAPWRTFPEVAQPVSAYVLRFFKGEEPRAGLFETGNTQWQVDAVRAIAAYLRTALGEDHPVLA